MTRTLFVLASLLALSGCQHYGRDFGDATRNNIAVQSVQPAPPVTAQTVPGDGSVTELAQERYAADKVKQPAATATSSVGSGSSGSGSSGSSGQ